MDYRTSPIPAFCKRPWRQHVVRGARCLQRGDFRRARFHFALAYRQSPEEPLVLFAWGRELLRQGRAERAAELLRAAWQRDPALIGAGCSLARALGLYLGRTGEAEGVLDRVEAEHGVAASTQLIRGEIALCEPTRPTLARYYFQHAEARGADPQVVRLGLARAFNAEGISLAEQGDHDRALFALKRAGDLSPEWSAPLVNRGAVFERLGLGRRAERDYQEALSLDPLNPTALFNLGDLLRRSGRRTRAKACFERLLAIQPGDSAARQALQLTLGSSRSRPVDPA